MWYNKLFGFFFISNWNITYYLHSTRVSPINFRLNSLFSFLSWVTEAHKIEKLTYERDYKTCVHRAIKSIFVEIFLNITYSSTSHNEKTINLCKCRLNRKNCPLDAIFVYTRGACIRDAFHSYKYYLSFVKMEKLQTFLRRPRNGCGAPFAHTAATIRFAIFGRLRWCFFFFS